MLRRVPMLAGGLWLLAGSPLAAATLQATATNFRTVFAAARAGDTIVMRGSFGRTALTDRSFATTLTLDARAATFTDTLSLSGISGVTVRGGRYGNANAAAATGIRVYGGSRITITNIAVVGNGTSSHGISVNATTDVTVSNSSFTGLRLGVGFTSVTRGKLLSNRSIRSSNDGFNVADSHNILVSRNSCSGTAITPGAHPDCVQLWSIKGRTPQSDIEISDNTATGATQGFTSFNGSDGGGDRIKMLRNRVDTSYPQGIACYECRDSVFSGNILTTQAGARHRTSINIVGGYGNTVSNNSVGDRPASMAESFEPMDFAASRFSDFDPVASGGDRNSFALSDGGDLSAAGAVPEPGTWLLMIGGFGLIGFAARRRRRAVAA